MRSLGIHVDSRKIRILDISITAKKLALNAVFEMDRGSGDSLSAILQNYFQNTPRPDRIVASVGNVPIVVKSFEFPFKDRSQVQQAMLGEFEDSLPIQIENYVLEAQHLGKENSSHLFVGALMSREPLEDMNRVFETIDVVPSDFLVPSEALGRLGLSMLFNEFQPGSTVCFCDIGYDFTQVSVVEFPTDTSKKFKASSYAKSLIDFRHISRGTKDIYELEGNKLALSAKEFENHLTSRVRYDSANVDNFKNAVRPLLVELYQVTQAAMSKSGQKVETFVITGSLAQCAGFKEFFETELRTPTLIWDPFQTIDTDKAPLSPDIAGRFTVPLALALRHGALSSLPWLNFRRSSKRKQVISAALEQFSAPEFRNRVIPLGLLCIGIFIVSIAASVLMGNRIDKQIKKTQNALSRAKAPLNSTPETFQDFKAKQFAKLPGKEKSVAFVDDLSKLSTSIGQNVRVEELSIVANSTGKNLQAVLNVDKNPSFSKETTEAALKNQSYTDISIEGQGPSRQLKMKGK